MKGIFDVGHNFPLPLFADTFLSIQTMAFVFETTRPTGWFHIVLTLQEKNVTVYYNTGMQSGEREDWIGHEADGPSDTVIGRYFVDYDDLHSNVIMDELAMWNRVLSEAEVAQIYDISFQ